MKKIRRMLLTALGAALFLASCVPREPQDGLKQPQAAGAEASAQPDSSASDIAQPSAASSAGGEEAFAFISELFPRPHDDQEQTEQQADLDGDGKDEKISLTNLGYNGGDGGYLLQVYRLRDGAEREIALPKIYSPENGFPFHAYWDGETMEIFVEEESIARLSKGQVTGLYEKKLYDEKELRQLLERNQGTEIRGDAVSGFAVAQQGGENVLIAKTYLSGLDGHVDCLGYGVTELRLQADDTWEIAHSFRLDQ
jgi:hypothetical protein